MHIPESWYFPRGRHRIDHPISWSRLPEFDIGIAFLQEKRYWGHQNWWAIAVRIGDEIKYWPVMGQSVFTSTPGSTTTVTSDATWSNWNNTVECIGAGSVAAIGASSTTSGGGGGGGAYTKIFNMQIANPGTTQFFVRPGAVPAAAGTAGDAWLTQTAPGTTFPAAAQVGLGARGATPIASTTTATGSNGGAGASFYANPSTGALHTSGGKGGNAGAANSRGGAGGGAGGEDGDGISPADSTSAAQPGGAGDAGIDGGGAGGPAGNGAGANGSPGKNINSIVPVGSGGGGGGGNAAGSTGGAGGLYGAGGGGGGRNTGTAGAGAQGVVVASWQMGGWWVEGIQTPWSPPPKGVGGVPT